MALIISGHLFLNALFSIFLLCVAGSNYPGGLAIAKLHRLEKDSVNPVHVHIDVLTAQTGVSRFTQRNDSWIYSKQENLSIDNPEILQFTHLLMEAKSKYSPNIKPYLKTHDILDSVDGFSHVSLNYNMLPPIRIKTRPIIFIMKRKANIKYDPKKAKAYVHTKQLAESYTETRPQVVDVINKTAKNMEPILGEIMESLEEFEKPLNTSSETESEIKSQEIKTAEDTTEINSHEQTEPLNVPQKAVNLSEDNSLSSEAPVQKEKVPNVSKVESSLNIESNISVQDAIINVSISDEKQVNAKSEEIEKEVVTEKPKVQQEGSTLKETVRKLIQGKMEAVKLKKEIEEQRKPPEVPEKIAVKKIEPAKIELQQKLKATAKQESKEMPTTVQEKTKKHRVVNVKESIRNIINQFREFEKDFGHEDLDSMKKETVLSKQSKEASTNLSQESVNDVDKSKEEDIKIVKDAKESLRDIINQFKLIKSELISEEDNELEEIEATFMDRSISETLMKFSESLKNLIHRRKQLKQSIAGDIKKDVAKSPPPPKVPVKEAQVLAESAKSLNIENVEKLETVDLNADTKDNLSTDTSKPLQEKSFAMYTNDENVPLSAQIFVDNVSNDVGKNYASKEEDDEQKNIENNTNN